MAEVRLSWFRLCFKNIHRICIQNCCALLPRKKEGSELRHVRAEVWKAPGKRLNILVLCMQSSRRRSAYFFLLVFGPGKRKGAQEGQIRAAILDGIGRNWKFLLSLVTRQQEPSKLPEVKDLRVTGWLTTPLLFRLLLH